MLAAISEIFTSPSFKYVMLAAAIASAAAMMERIRVNLTARVLSMLHLRVAPPSRKALPTMLGPPINEKSRLLALHR